MVDVASGEPRLQGIAASALACLLLTPASLGSAQDRVPARIGTLTVHVSGVRNGKGHVLVSVWPGPQGFPSDPVKIIGPKAVSIDATSHGASATFENLPAGDYSVTVMHDENDNGKMDKNLLGIPKEGFGVSNDPKKKLHMPTFDETKFRFDGSVKSLDITLKYF